MKVKYTVIWKMVKYCDMVCWVTFLYCPCESSMACHPFSSVCTQIHEAEKMKN